MDGSDQEPPSPSSLGFARQWSPAGKEGFERQRSPFGRQRSPFGRQRSPFGRQRSPGKQTLRRQGLGHAEGRLGNIWVAQQVSIGVTLPVALKRPATTQGNNFPNVVAPCVLEVTPVNFARSEVAPSHHRQLDRRPHSGRSRLDARCGCASSTPQCLEHATVLGALRGPLVRAAWGSNRLMPVDVAAALGETCESSSGPGRPTARPHPPPPPKPVLPTDPDRPHRPAARSPARLPDFATDRPTGRPTEDPLDRPTYRPADRPTDRTPA